MLRLLLDLSRESPQAKCDPAHDAQTASQEDDYTPLIIACHYGSFATVEFLLEYGVDIQLRDAYGLSPLFHALDACEPFNAHYAPERQKTSEDIVRLLLKRGATIDPNEHSEIYELALASQNPKVIRMVIESGVDVNTPICPHAHIFRNNAAEPTALNVAASQGDFDFAHWLLKRDARVNFPDKPNPLGIAARYGHESIVRLLLEHGATVNILDDKSRSPLIHVLTAENNRTARQNIAQLLLSHGALPMERYALHVAANWGDLFLLEQFLERGADVHARNGNQETPLFTAAAYGDPDNVLLLLKHGAEVELLNREDETPLLIAARGNHLPVVALLLRAGASPNVVRHCDYPMTPLHYAADHGNDTMVSLLLQYGADVNARTDEILSPVFGAMRHNHFSIVRLLLQNGANANERGGGYNRPLLMHAALMGCPDTVALLLDHGAEIDARDTRGVTALIEAAFEGQGDIVDVLLERGANITFRSQRGATALEAAIRRGHTQIADALRAGAVV